MALIDSFNLATNDDFERRVSAAAWKAAADILAESPETADHAKRMGFALVISNSGPGSEVFRQLTRLCAMNTTLAASSPGEWVDGDVQFAVNGEVGVLAIAR